MRLAFSGPGDCSGVDDAFGVPRALPAALPSRGFSDGVWCFLVALSADGAVDSLAGVLVPLWERLRSKLVELVLFAAEIFGSGGFSSFGPADTPVTAIEAGRGFRCWPADCGRDRRYTTPEAVVELDIALPGRDVFRLLGVISPERKPVAVVE